MTSRPKDEEARDIMTTVLLGRGEIQNGPKMTAFMNDFLVIMQITIDIIPLSQL